MLTLGIGACTRSAVQPLPEAIARLEFMILLAPAPFQRTWSLAGRYEVTQAEYGLEVRRTELNLPVSMVTFFEADAWCKEHQLRLPTQWEWQQLATSGRGGFVVPETARNSLALGLRRRLPVGVFERGKTSLGAYDVLGNVREWCVDPTSDAYYACGGSFATRDASSGVIGQLEMLPEERAEDVGFRYFTDADAYLLNAVLPIWPQLTRSEQEQAMEYMLQWRANYRIGLAEELRLKEAPEDFCTALAQP